MSITLQGETDEEKFKQLISFTYEQQAKFFLDFAWKTTFENSEEEREKIWKWTHALIDADHQKGKDGMFECIQIQLNILCKIYYLYYIIYIHTYTGCEVEEVAAHHFLETIGSTTTNITLRNSLRENGLKVRYKLSLIEFQITQYSSDWHKLVNVVQGSSEELVKAEELCKIAREKMDQAKNHENAAQVAYKAQLDAENELRTVLKTLEEEEEKYNSTIKELETRSNDQGLGIVARNTAANRLQQLRSTDYLPLRKAKINQEAAVRKSEKLSAEAENKKQIAEEARKEAESSYNEAKSYLDEVASSPTSCDGSIWWMQRSLEEEKHYIPQSMGGYRKK